MVWALTGELEQAQKRGARAQEGQRVKRRRVHAFSRCNK
jgi:hypothetical protein